MSSISKHNLTLLLLGAAPEGGVSEGLGGITRLQKYLFLLEKEGGITPEEGNFQFEAYKAGPYSSKLYDDLEFLENLGLIESEITAQASPEEAVEITELTFDDLMGDGSVSEDGNQYDGFGASDACEERRFILTAEGRKKVEDIIGNPAYRPVIDAIRKIKSRFSSYSLSDLLYYVYTRYPEMTTESEIKDKVLRRGR